MPAFALVVACHKPVAPQLFEAPEGRFRIGMPNKPQKFPLTFETPWGPVNGSNWIAKSTDGKLSFTAAYADWPQSALDAHSTDWFLDSGRDGMIKTLQGTLTREVRIEKDGYPGREAIGNIPSLGLIWGRIFMVGSRYYQVSVIMPPEMANSPEVHRYLDSFSFDKPE